LYFKALTEGLADAPPIPEDLRAELAAALKAQGPAALHVRLHPEDAARIRPGDPARILRALEVAAVTGGSLAALQGASSATALTARTGLALIPDRARLYAALDARFDAMLAAGALEEARALMGRGLDPDLPAMKALGLRPLIAHLRGDLSRAAAA